MPAHSDSAMLPGVHVNSLFFESPPTTHKHEINSRKGKKKKEETRAQAMFISRFFWTLASPVGASTRGVRVTMV